MSRAKNVLAAQTPHQCSFLPSGIHVLAMKPQQADFKILAWQAADTGHPSWNIKGSGGASSVSINLPTSYNHFAPRTSRSIQGSTPKHPGRSLALKLNVTCLSF